MGKWTCLCGQAMNDHKVPDKNAYSVYSDELWDGFEFDNDNKVSYEEIADASFYMYKCPKCGSFMVFGEGDDDPNRFTFYRKEK